MHGRVLKGLAWALIAICSLHIAKAASQQEEKLGKTSKEVAGTSQAPSEAVYRVEYSVRELQDGKRINARNYKVLVRNEKEARVRVGSRVPYLSSKDQFQYADVGINIDCRVTEQRDNDVTLFTRFESSSVARPGDEMTAGGNPVFRHVSTEVESIVMLGKPTVINVVDDVVSTHQYEIEVTVTKVK